jgi:hypothetical protein
MEKETKEIYVSMTRRNISNLADHFLALCPDFAGVYVWDLGTQRNNSDAAGCEAPRGLVGCCQSNRIGDVLCRYRVVPTALVQ